ncbi:hypothetical protein AK830_g21 [Neonectria ditissima]|uniref:Aspergillopepsin-2 n=1 Tax=Neonectria ditissima TaxID=78410 RepID=A0A0N8H942_9HYPO|nr:hypothetical protein AK830_g21 [Neonectria ditissima]
MRFTLFLAVASVVAAAPGRKLIPRDTSPLVPRSARRARYSSAPNQRLSSVDSVNDSNVEYSGNWGGAVKIGSGYNQVEGTIIVPEVSGASGSAASTWVGIDGDTCQTAILQTGVSFYADGSFNAWYEWIPDYAYNFNNFDISVGDEIKMSVDASSKTKGVATLENLTTNQKVTHTFTNTPSTLCETNAEWIVEAFQENGSQVTLVDFGTVTFTDASVSGSGGTSGPQGADILDISPDQGETVLAQASVSGSSVTVEYVGN